MTGLPSVDSAAYLRQAAELESGGGKSQGDTHPETFLRAQALDKWWKADDDLDQWLETHVRGPLSITALDLLRQNELTQLTRAFFALFLTNSALRSDQVLTQVRRFFPDWLKSEDATAAKALTARVLDEPTRGYLVALMLDCAMADPDAKDELLLAAGRTAKGFGGLDQFRTALKRDLKFTKAAIDKLFGRLSRAT
jgi:hypothetical protein